MADVWSVGVIVKKTAFSNFSGALGLWMGPQPAREYKTGGDKKNMLATEQLKPRIVSITI